MRILICKRVVQFCSLSPSKCDAWSFFLKRLTSPHKQQAGERPRHVSWAHKVMFGRQVSGDHRVLGLRGADREVGWQRLQQSGVVPGQQLAKPQATLCTL